jgi:DNA-binding NarL/FixJ family response regulator
VSAPRRPRVRVEVRPLSVERMQPLPRMPSPGKPLTRRELPVLELIAEGLTNEQIARRLDYAPGTVSTMVQRILRKLDVPSRAAAVDRAWRKGLLGPGLVSSVHDRVR